MTAMPESDHELNARLGANPPIGRPVVLEEMASAVLCLCSDAASYVAG